MIAHSNVLVLFGFGDTSIVLLFLVGFFLGCVAYATAVVGAWVIFARLGTATAAIAIVLGTLSAIAYEVLYHGDLTGVPMMGAALGALVVTNATLVIVMLIRADRRSSESQHAWPHVRIRTLVAVMAVVAAILATLIPAVRAF